MQYQSKRKITQVKIALTQARIQFSIVSDWFVLSTCPGSTPISRGQEIVQGLDLSTRGL